MISNEDNVLFERIRNGDQAAKKKLVSRTHEQVNSVVRSRLGWQNEDCGDLINKVYLATFKSLQDGKFEPTKGTSLNAYVYGITRNKIRDHYKEKDKDKVVRDNPPLDLDLVEEAKAQQELEREERAKALRKVLEKLDKKYQEVLYLRYYEDLSIGEISEHISLPAPRVSERINYAKKLLRKDLEKMNDFSILGSFLLINT